MSDSISVKVAGSAGRSYDVQLFADGRVYCTCPAWRFQKVDPIARVCKHTSRARAAATVVLSGSAVRAA